MSLGEETGGAPNRSERAAGVELDKVPGDEQAATITGRASTTARTALFFNATAVAEVVHARQYPSKWQSRVPSSRSSQLVR